MKHQLLLECQASLPQRPSEQSVHSSCNPHGVIVTSSLSLVRVGGPPPPDVTGVIRLCFDLSLSHLLRTREEKYEQQQQKQWRELLPAYPGGNWCGCG